MTALEITAGGVSVTLDPPFDPEIFSYRADLRLADAAVDLTATADLAIEIDASPATSGEARSIDLALGTSAIEIAVIDANDARRVYTVDANRGAGILERARVESAVLDPGDTLAAAVAISGDTMIVGAPVEASDTNGIDGDATDNNADEAGAAYVFVRDGSGAWQQQAYLKASASGLGDRFGAAVAIDGDRAVVGAPGEDSAATTIGGAEDDDNASGAGAVYAFSRTAGIWTQAAYIKASNAGAGDGFGAAVALSGDTLVVGASGEDGPGNGAASAGAAYVFVDAGGWSEQAVLRAGNAQSGDLFGGAVSIDGERIAVGAAAEASAGAQSGAAYVFSRSGVSWTEDAYLVASNVSAGDNFGDAVAISGDTLAVGAFTEDSSATGVGGDEDDDTIVNSGAVYVFVEAGGWTQQAYIKASNTNSGDGFGGAVAIDGDVLVVGATSESGGDGGVNGDDGDNAINDAGAAYVFVRDGVTWSQQAYVKAATPSASATFAAAVAVDEFSIVAGAPGEGSAAGAIYAFD